MVVCAELLCTNDNIMKCNATARWKTTRGCRKLYPNYKPTTFYCSFCQCTQTPRRRDALCNPAPLSLLTHRLLKVKAPLHPQSQGLLVHSASLASPDSSKPRKGPGWMNAAYSHQFWTAWLISSDSSTGLLTTSWRAFVGPITLGFHPYSLVLCRCGYMAFSRTF